MGTITAAELISRAEKIVVDAGATRWGEAEWLEWLNDGQREIATLVPDSSSKIANVDLVAGTKQSTPSDCIRMLRFIRNMGAGGATPGTVVRQVSQALMDLQRPTWHIDTASATVKNVMYDPDVPGVFYNWPPLSGATKIEAAYSALPADLDDAADAISLDDDYSNPLLDYMLYRAFSKDVEIEGLGARADAHYAAMMRSLGLSNKAKEGA